MMWNADLAVILNRLEEMTLVVFVPLAIIEFIKNRKSIDKILIFLVLPIIILGISGLVSGMVNGNSLYVTALGTFDNVKIFLALFIYAVFFRDPGNFEKIFRPLLKVAIFICLIALIQEIWALSYRYILGKDIHDAGMYILQGMPADVRLQRDLWRLGIYRAPSLLGHYNILGFYSLLILTIYLFNVKKVNLLVFCALSAGIVLSSSTNY
jgi:hypothetical protein